MKDDKTERCECDIDTSKSVKFQSVVEGDEENFKRKIVRHADKYMGNNHVCVDKTRSEQKEVEDNLEYKINESVSDNSEGALEMFEEMDNISIRWLEFPYQAVMKDRVHLLGLCAQLGTI